MNLKFEIIDGERYIKPVNEEHRIIFQHCFGFPIIRDVHILVADRLLRSHGFHNNRVVLNGIYLTPEEIGKII